MTLPTTILDVGFTTDPSTANYWHIGDPVRGRIGTAAIGPADQIFTHLASDQILSWQFRGAANRLEGPMVRYDAGQLSVILKDTDGRFDPDNTTGPYALGGISQVTPMRPVRLRVTHDGVTYGIFRGYADRWKILYQTPAFNVVRLVATDPFKVLARANLAEVAPVGADEDTGARIDRVLDALSPAWPTTDRMIDVGKSMLQATIHGGNALAEIHLANETELGEFFADGDGRLVFRNRHSILTRSASNTSQATFGGGGGSELPYSEPEMDNDDDVLYNVSRVSRAGGTEQSASDAASLSQYLEHAHTASGLLMTSDSEALSYAAYVVAQLKDPQQRWSGIRIIPRGHGDTYESDLFTQVLARGYGDRITVRRRPPGGLGPYDQDVYVRGIQHDVTAESWETAWVLQPATQFQFWTIGHPEYGKIDAGYGLAH